jgi:hypothetical protein
VNQLPSRNQTRPPPGMPVRSIMRRSPLRPHPVAHATSPGLVSVTLPVAPGGQQHQGFIECEQPPSPSPQASLHSLGLCAPQEPSTPALACLLTRLGAQNLGHAKPGVSDGHRLRPGCGRFESTAGLPCLPPPICILALTFASCQAVGDPSQGFVNALFFGLMTQKVLAAPAHGPLLTSEDPPGPHLLARVV